MGLCKRLRAHDRKVCEATNLNARCQASGVTMSERKEGGSSPLHPAKKTIKTHWTMRKLNWAKCKAMNALLRCTGDNKERRYTSVKGVEHSMIMDAAPRRVELERNVFRAGNIARPQKGKARNGFSREEAGTIGAITMGIRTGAYSVCVCKTQNKW